MFNQEYQFDENWHKLKTGLTEIFSAFHKTEEDEPSKITTKAWMNHYNIVYSWCTQPMEDKKQELYHQVVEFFNEFVTVELNFLQSDHVGETLLVNYLHRFTIFTTATRMINNIFKYMHRYWIPNQRTSGSDSVREIYEVSLLCWRQCCFDFLSDKLLTSLLMLVEADRNGDVIDKSLVKNVVLSYIEIGVLEEEPVLFYKEKFENEFVENTRKYYTIESDEYLVGNSVSAYMMKAEERLEQEEKLAEQYLHPSTYKTVVKACESALIERHMQILQDAFQNMLRDDKQEDMKRFYGLLSRIEGGLVNSSDTLRGFLTVEGSAKVDAHAVTLQKKDDVANAIGLINSLLELHKNYAAVILDCFDNHKLFVQSMDEAFAKFINVDVGTFTMAELLNFYVDHLLKGDERLAEDQLEDITSATVRIFTYFDDKDLFYASFRRSLSQRLLGRKINEDAERSFIAKLKRKCGDVYTKKLEGMFNDIKLSTSRKNEFKDYCVENDISLGLDFSVYVLNKLFWPLSKTTDLALSSTLLSCVDAFERYYKGINEKHKLTWLYAYGSVQIAYSYVNQKKQGKKVELIISCIQSSILVLFNEKKQWTITEIREALQLPLDYLKRAIIPLLYSKQRCLINRGEDGTGKEKQENGKAAGPKDLSDNDILMSYPIHASVKKKRITYPALSNSSQDKTKNSSQMKKKAMEERTLKMELAIVRVMKARNVLSIQELVAEGSKQLIKFFKPNPRLMKKRIENLMERGFMRRDEEDQRLLHYCA